MQARAAVLFLLASDASAFLPPDAGVRAPQLMARRQVQEKVYEQKQQQRIEDSNRAYQQAQTDIFTPPWMTGQVREASAASDILRGTVTSQQPEKRNYRFSISVVLLMLLGAVVCWIRHATREIDE